MKTKKTIGISGLIVLFLVALDQLVKYLSYANLRGKEPFVIMNDVFELHYLENESAAFGIDPVSILHRIFHFKYFDENPAAFLNAKMIFFVIITLAILIWLIVFYCKRIPSDKRFRYLDWTIIAFVAGAIGNLIDRVVHNYVIDMFYVKAIEFPIFNVADIYVTVAAIALILLGCFYYKSDDFDLLFPSKKKDNSEE